MYPEKVAINTAPGKEYALENRLWQGCPTILRTRGGKIYAGWYSGGFDEPDQKNYNLLIRSCDNGWTWSQPLCVVPSDMSRNFIAIDIQLWLDPLDRMWMFITQRYIGGERNIFDPDHLALWAFICDDPNADELVWSEPQYITNGFLRTQPTVLSNGDWVLCAYSFLPDHYLYARSKDQGKSWFRCVAGKKQDPDFDETMIVERKDGTLCMFARDRTPLLVKTVSTDLEGSSWTPGKHIKLLSGCTRFYLRRLASGRVLLIHNDSSTFRTNLTARLSEDDMATWKYSLLLDTAENPARNVSYPDAVEDEQGNIYIIYDRGRKTFREILMAQIREEDIINGSICSGSSYLRRIISKAPVPADQEKYDRIREEYTTWNQSVFQRIYRNLPAVSGKL